ncbi:hypothetical protein TruAng_012008 [Truncatella angustata]|nr:hypothetical protein TruAng_012008 [Truncatella angustata]
MRDTRVHTGPSCRRVWTPQAKESEGFIWATILHNASNGCELFQWFKRRIEQIYDVGPLAERRKWFPGPITEQSISLSRFTDSQHHADENKEPQTITDAIRVTYLLGLRYLWVDALCIIQDDDADKAHELGRMGSIYTGANITIRASMCSTSRDAFTSARLWHEELPICETLMPINGGMSVPVRLLQSPEPDGLREPIDSRAWCSQEWLLSRRTLNFDSRFVWWKCPVCVRTDGGPTSLRLGGISWLELGEKGHESLGHYDPDEALNKWMDCVLDYQNRQLTVEADNLPAIAAVAEYLNKYIFGEYMAVPKLPPAALRPQPCYRAPSWSWASVNDTELILSVTQVSGETLLEVVSYSSTPTFANILFGAVDSASITVRATNDSHPKYPDSGFDHNFQFDSEDDKAYVEKAVSIFMLEVSVDNNGGVSGLLLSPKVERSYKRVGTFYILTNEITYIDESIYDRCYSGPYSEMCLPASNHFRGESNEEKLQGRETADIPPNDIEEPSKGSSEGNYHSSQMPTFEVPNGYHGDDEEEPSDQESSTTKAPGEQIQSFQTSPSGSEDDTSSEGSDKWDPELVPGLDFFAGLDKIEIVLV